MNPTMLRSSLLCALLALTGCQGRAVVPFDAGVESDCMNGLDDDGDGRVDCLDADCASSDACLHFSGPSRPLESLESRALDLLVVMDNSGGFFAADREALLVQIRDLVTRLRATEGWPLDLHLGVTSTDLGTGLYPITYCEEAGGDGGRLLKGACVNPTGGQSYLIDVAPASCDATRDDQGLCGSHTCTQAGCDAAEPGTWLQQDDQGCPRCRNYQGVTLEDAFACLANLGTTGCGFEQPLESLFKALDNNPANTGFIREQARLAVLLVTNEDDCSASTPQLFDNTQTALESTLGPLTSFRCFEFGVTCDENDRTTTGPRTGCRPRDDPEALLYPIARYVSFMHGLKDPRQLWVGLVAGPGDATVLVERDTWDQPEVQPACASADASATPAIRLQAFVNAFRTAEPPNGASQSICEDGFAQVIDDLVAGWAGWQPTCFPGAVAGCTDPAVPAGLPGDGNPCNDVCQARCEVLEVRTLDPDSDWIDPLEVQRVVPPCLEICPEGPCPGNPDPTLAYQGSRPELIDPWLPAESCWFVAHEPACTRSRGAALAIANREPWNDYAGPGPRFQAYCFAVSDPDDPGCP